MPLFFNADVILVTTIIRNIQHEYLESVCVFTWVGFLEGKNGTCPSAGVVYYLTPRLNLCG